MSNIEARVEHLERDANEIKVTLARMGGCFDAIDAKFSAVNTKLDSLNNRFDSVVTWKAAFVGLAVLLTGLAGIAWWVVQQILTPLLQATGAS